MDFKRSYYRTEKHGSEKLPRAMHVPSSADLFFKERLDESRLNEFSFASRKLPEFMNHRLVRCRNCDVVYVDALPPKEDLAQAYHVAAYDSAGEAFDAATTYADALDPILAALPRKSAVLEVGTDTGILLEKLAERGFEKLVGIEPSSAAIAAASLGTRSWIREGVFHEADFEPESFDLVCCFMTMEHVSDLGVLARAARCLLRKGGAFVTVTHDYRALLNRVLGSRSPSSTSSICNCFLAQAFVCYSNEPDTGTFAYDHYGTRTLSTTGYACHP